MDSLFQQLKKLYENELHENVLHIACILESAYERDRSLLIPEQYFLMLMYNGNSLYQQQQYRKAIIVYRGALIARKALTKTKPATVLSHNYDNLVEMFPDHEICYKTAQCMEMTKNISEALTMLQSISNKQRTLKVNMMLGRLSIQCGKYAQAIPAFKMVVRESPLNLEAIKSLLMMGVSDLEIGIIIAESNLPAQCTDWLTAWIDAHTSMFKCRFNDAITKLDTIQSNSKFAKNEIFNVLLGQCHYYNGDNDNALKYLVRAHANNFYLLDGLTTLAALYAIKNQTEDLEKLTRLYMSSAEYTTEHWFVFAQHSFVHRRFEKASNFAHKACYLKRRNIEACLLKAKLFLEMKKFKEAIMQLNQLMEFAKYRLEVYDGLVTAYIATSKFREAQKTATDAVRILGKSPRTFVLVARALLSNSATKSKAKPFLEKALELNKHYWPALLLLVEVLQEEDDTATAIRLLKRMAEVQPSSELFTTFGDVYASEKDTLKALQSYTHAITLDPNNRKAVNQLAALEQSLTSKDETLLCDTTAASNDRSDCQDSNFEMIEVQQLTPPDERLPDIEEESEGLLSDVETDVSNNE